METTGEPQRSSINNARVTKNGNYDILLVEIPVQRKFAITPQQAVYILNFMKLSKVN